jgi:hypothetical protein
VVDRERLAELLNDPAWAESSFGSQTVDRDRAGALLGDPTFDSFEYEPRGATPPGPVSSDPGSRQPDYPVDLRELDPAAGIEPLPGAPTTPQQADAQSGAALDRTLRTGTQAAADKFAAEKAEAQRLAGVDERALAEQEENERVRTRAFQLAQQAAEKETADWLKRQQEAASAEADPSRYFHNKNTFGKVAWVIGLIAGSLSAGADQSKNVALKMLSDAIDQDMQSQNASIGRKMDVLRAEGSAIDKRQARAFQEVNDAAAGRFQRLQALRNYLTTQAKIPGSEARKASLSAADNWAAMEQQKVIETRAQRTHQEHAAAVERRWRERESAKARAHDASEAQKARNFNMNEKEKDRQLDRDLATISASAKGGADLDPYGTPKDWDYFDEGSGVLLVGPDGQKKGLLVRKGENAAAVEKTLNAASQELVGLTRLRDAYAKSDGTERALNSDPELTAAISDLAAARAKAMNSGAMSEEDRKQGYLSTLGFDKTSVIAKLKGPSKDEVLKFLDRQIQDHSGHWNVRVRAASKVRLPQGATLQFRLPKELEPRSAGAPTHQDALAESGVATGSLSAPKTPAEVWEARERFKTHGGRETDYLPDLAPELDTALSRLGPAADGARLESVDAALEVANEAIAKWEKAQPDKAVAKAQADDARVRAQADYLDAQAKAATARDRLVQAGANVASWNDDRSDVEAAIRDEAASNKIGLEPADLKALVQEAEKRAARQGYVPNVGVR